MSQAALSASLSSLPQSGALRGVSADDSVSWMKAAGETTRFRLLALLSEAELTVSDLVEIVDQSQPRLSRHLKLLVEAGLAQRFQEGAWAYFAIAARGAERRFLDAILDPIDLQADPLLAEDSRRLVEVFKKRRENAAEYFARNAAQWDKIRSLHVAEDKVEQAMLDLGLRHGPSNILDLGTGTGRILQLFAPHLQSGTGIDTSHDMLAVARAGLAAGPHDHLQIRHGNVYSLPGPQFFDLVVLHQVLHFLENPALAIANAARRMTRDGRLMIVDFLPHDIESLQKDHAHRRQGIAPEQAEEWLNAAGLDLLDERTLAPPADDGTALTVVIWLAGRG